MNLKIKTYWIYLAITCLPVLMDMVWPYGLTGDSLSPALMGFIPSLLYTMFAVAGFLGWRLNQTRILIASLLFMSAVYFSFHADIFMAWNVGPRELSQIYSMGLPLTLLMVLRLKETRLNEIQNISKLATALAPMVLFFYWGVAVSDDFKLLTQWQIFETQSLHIPQFALICLAVFFAGTFRIKDKKIQHFVVGSAFSQIPLFTAVRALQVDPFPGYDPALHNFIAFGIIAGILLHSIFHMYWQRVYIDELTSIANRRALDEYLAKLNGEYAIAMIDIDHFKGFNDTYGHDEGDNVLRLVAQILDEELKDKVYRYGGEEFCAVFEGVSGEDAFMLANRVRRQVEDREFHIRTANSKRKPTSEKQRGKKRRGKKARVTISIGLASQETLRQTPEDVIILADKALYIAKDEGRNRVVLSEPKRPVRGRKKVKA